MPLDRALLGRLVLALLLVCECATLRGARAEEFTAPVLAIIDVQKILRESTAVKALTKIAEEQRSKYQIELRAKEEALRNADQELARQRTVLSAEAFAQKRNELEQQVAGLQRQVQERKRELDQVFANGMGQVQSELAEVAKEIAEENGIDLVLTKATVVIVKPKLDITNEALKRLNERLATVALPALQN